MVDPSEQPCIVDPAPTYSDQFRKDEPILFNGQSAVPSVAESPERENAYLDAGNAEFDDTESTDDGVSYPGAVGAENSTAASEESPGLQHEDDQLLNSGFVSTPAEAKKASERGEPEERGFSTSAQALDAAEAARMKGNVAYSLGHLYNAISMYLLANRHLAYAATLESGALRSSYPLLPDVLCRFMARLHTWKGLCQVLKCRALFRCRRGRQCLPCQKVGMQRGHKT